MPENSVPKRRTYTEEEKLIRKDFIEDLETITSQLQALQEGKESPLRAAKNWVTIWVLSGPEVSLDESEHEDNQGNQTRERLEAGFKLMREVVEVRSGKKLQELDEQEVRTHAPKFYYNGTEAENTAFRAWLETGELESRFGIPRDLIQIKNVKTMATTRDQVKEFPLSLAPQENEKLVVVSDFYHLPRVKRLLENENSNLPGGLERTILYPAQPKLRIKRALSEMKKIPLYIQHGWLPKENPDQKINRDS